MHIGIELRTTTVNGKRYWRIAPIIIATDRQKMYLGAAAVIIAFVISIMMLPDGGQS